MKFALQSYFLKELTFFHALFLLLLSPSRNFLSETTKVSKQKKHHENIKITRITTVKCMCKVRKSMEKKFAQYHNCNFKSEKAKYTKNNKYVLVHRWNINSKYFNLSLYPNTGTLKFKGLKLQV